MNSLSVFDSLTVGFPPILLDAAFKSTLLLVLAGVALRCLRRTSAAGRHLTLFLVVGSLLVLPILSWTLPGLDVLPAWWSRGVSGVTAVADPPSAPAVAPARETRTAASPHALPVTPVDSRRNEAVGSTRVAPSGHFNRWSEFLWRWAPVVWLAGFLGALAPAALGLVSLWRLQRSECREDLSSLSVKLDRLAASVGLPRRVQLILTESRQMPMTWGFLRPKILVPAAALDWPEERQRVVLLHEIAHIQRADFVSTLVTRLTCALYWFNPFVWLAARQLRLEQEQACDDVVLGAGAQPAAYAEEVLRIASGRTAGNLEACGALAMARPSTLEGRLLAILDASRNRASLNRVAVAGTVVLTALAVIPMSMLRAGQETAVPASAVPSPQATAPVSAVDRGLLAWWRADGDGKDSVGKHDGDFPFGIRYGPGLSGKAFDFRRSYEIQNMLQRVSIPDSPDFQLSETFTLEVRIKPRNFGGIVLLRGDDRPGFDTWQLDLITPGKISFNFDNAENKSAEILAPIPLNQWQHVVAIFDRGTMKLYIDGGLAALAQTELRPNPILDSQHDPALGIGNTGGKRYSIPFDGFIDDVRIYNRALSETEIAERLKG